ncbi:MAG: hypothetical protein ACK4RK_09000 [Gemmataceae bacterium]
MHKQKMLIAFDVDNDSLVSIREALPEWDCDVVNQSCMPGFASRWHPGTADLLIVGMDRHKLETLKLCQFLTAPASDSETMPRQERASPMPRLVAEGKTVAIPLLVLVPAGQEALAKAALEAGAHSCLFLPIHPQDVIRTMAHAQAGNQPGRHTINLQQPQSEDLWRDEGGEG